MIRAILAYALCFIATVVGGDVFADDTACVYIDRSGLEKEVPGLSSVPYDLRRGAKCGINTKSDYLANPEEISLKGNVREQQISSPLGRMSLRWPRSVESLFGRTPERALADAAATVNRVLKMQGFPLSVQSLNLSWQVVFMDERVPVAQIPYSLISNCHPAWMTPPANLYVVSQRVAEGCGGNRGSASVNDAQLAQILIHEIGHAIEFQLLRGHGAGDRIRAEGFACWFEQYASDYSSVTTRGSVRKKYLTLAKESYRQEPNQFNFRGTAMDYARASTLFYAVVEKAGIRGLMDVYGKMAESELSFGEAVQARFGWNADRFLNEAKSFAQKAD